MQQNSFTLHQPQLRVELDSSDGNVYPINPSFKVVLACLDKVSDPDVTDLAACATIAVRFFLGNPPPDMRELFKEFVLGSSDDAPDDDDPKMDFIQDAAALYTSFRQQYSIDLIHDDLHWVEFKLLLQGLGEATQFGQLLKIRDLDLSDCPEKDRAKLRTLKDMFAIKPRISQREQELSDALDAKLRAGEDPAELLREL